MIVLIETHPISKGIPCCIDDIFNLRIACFSDIDESAIDLESIGVPKIIISVFLVCTHV